MDFKVSNKRKEKADYCWSSEWISD